MVSNVAKPPVVRPRSTRQSRVRKWVIVLVLVTGSGVLFAINFQRFVWPGVKLHYSPQQVAQRQREQQRAQFRASYTRQVDAMVALAVNRIRALGGTCDEQWRKCDGVLYDIDLSKWQGADEDLDSLLPFRILVSTDRDFTLTLSSKTTDDDLSYIGNLTNLMGLTIAGTSITDSGLQHLEKLDSLWSLDLSGTRISDQSIDYLARPKSLHCLNVSNTQITPAGIARLTSRNDKVEVVFLGGCAAGTSLRFDDTASPAVIKNFLDTPHFVSINAVPASFADDDLAFVTTRTDWVGLDLSGSQVTDAGLRHLSGQRNLIRLDLGSTALTGSGFEVVKELTSLSNLSLARTMVTDAELKQLKKMPALCTLSLSGTAVTGSGLLHLSDMPSLRHLSLYGSEVSLADAEKWHLTMPAVTVRLRGGPLEGGELARPDSNTAQPPPVE